MDVNLPEPEGVLARRRSIPRVCIIGAESTGKTTLAAALAEHYSTVFVPEYGAPYHYVGRGDPHRTWTPDEFIHIARIREWLEEFLAGYADRVLFCDTDTFVTAVFHEVYLGTKSEELEAEARACRYSLYLLCDPETPFHADKLGLRREDARQRMHARYAEYVRSTGCAWIELHGAHEERMRTATAAIDGIIG